MQLQTSCFNEPLTLHYYVLLIRIVDYESAIEVAVHRRDIPPAIYNERRLKETPVPNTEQGHHTQLESSSNSDSQLEIISGNQDQPNDMFDDYVIGDVSSVYANELVEHECSADDMFPAIEPRTMKFEVQNDGSDLDAVSNILAESSGSVMNQGALNCTSHDATEEGVDVKNEQLNLSQKVVFTVRKADTTRFRVNTVGETSNGMKLTRKKERTKRSHAKSSGRSVVHTIHKAHGMEWNVEEVDGSNKSKAMKSKKSHILSTFTVESNKSHGGKRIIATNSNDVNVNFDGSKRSEDVHSASAVVSAQSHVNVQSDGNRMILTNTKNGDASEQTTERQAIEQDKATADDESDDLIGPEEGCVWPMPKKFELEGLIKKENDKFSGDLAFAQKANIIYFN